MIRDPRTTTLALVLAWLFVVGSPLVGSPLIGQDTGDAPSARNLVLIVADGAGVGTWTVARLALGETLAVAGMPVVGLVDTRNAYGGLTDSAAGATALATGVRTFNRAIAVAPECRELMERDPDLVELDPEDCAPVPTLLEHAEDAGKSTGLVTTTAVTDATPASFAAHGPSRYLHRSLAPQLLASGVDVVLGGGRQHFDGSEPTGAGDLLTAACADADCPADAAALAAVSSGEGRLIGLFAAGEMPRAGSRTPDLPTMTRVALDRLSRNDEGFFLLVESEGTDSYQHDNDPLASIEAEIVELDRAVAVALDFAERVPGTLVVVTADHETGGLSVTGEASSPERELHYTTGRHTHAMVPLFAAGPGAERLAGIRDNDEVGRILRELFIGW
jgi:alkaline phosphatase